MCDDPDYFYDYSDQLLAGLGATQEIAGAQRLHFMLLLHCRQGSACWASCMVCMHHNPLAIVKAHLHSAGTDARGMFTAVQAKGAGYAMSTAEELEAIQQIALTTGIIMDPVYSGKALHKLLQDMRANPEEWRGRKVLFLHTGGLLGMYDKVSQLQPLVEKQGRTQRMAVAG